MFSIIQQYDTDQKNNVIQIEINMLKINFIKRKKTATSF